MVKYTGRRSNQITTNSTNQSGLKLSGSSNLIGSKARYTKNRVTNNIKVCGPVYRHGVIWSTNTKTNSICLPPAPKCQSIAGGIGRKNAPRFSCATSKYHQNNIDNNHKPEPVHEIEPETELDLESLDQKPVYGLWVETPGIGTGIYNNNDRYTKKTMASYLETLYDFIMKHEISELGFRMPTVLGDPWGNSPKYIYANDVPDANTESPEKTIWDNFKTENTDQFTNTKNKTISATATHFQGSCIFEIIPPTGKVADYKHTLMALSLRVSQTRRKGLSILFIPALSSDNGADGRFSVGGGYQTDDLNQRQVTIPIKGSINPVFKTGSRYIPPKTSGTLPDLNQLQQCGVDLLCGQRLVSYYNAALVSHLSVPDDSSFSRKTGIIMEMSEGMAARWSPVLNPGPFSPDILNVFSRYAECNSTNIITKNTVWGITSFISAYKEHTAGPFIAWENWLTNAEKLGSTTTGTYKIPNEGTNEYEKTKEVYKQISSFSQKGIPMLMPEFYGLCGGKDWPGINQNNALKTENPGQDLLNSYYNGGTTIDGIPCKKPLNRSAMTYNTFTGGNAGEGKGSIPVYKVTDKTQIYPNYIVPAKGIGTIVNNNKKIIDSYCQLISIEPEKFGGGYTMKNDELIKHWDMPHITTFLSAIQTTFSTDKNSNVNLDPSGPMPGGGGMTGIPGKFWFFQGNYVYKTKTGTSYGQPK